MNFYEHLLEIAKVDGIEKIVVGGIVLNTNNNGEILVMTRKATDTFLSGIDELPSGGLNNDETILQGLEREIKEETNLDIERIESYLDYFDYLSRSGKKARQFNFVIKSREGEIKLTEHDAYKWQTAEEALANPKITDEVK